MSEPTISELVSAAGRAGAEDLGALMERAEAGTLLADRVEAVLKRHKQVTSGRNAQICNDCCQDWPCATVRDLNGEP